MPSTGCVDRIFFKKNNFEIQNALIEGLFQITGRPDGAFGLALPFFLQTCRPYGAGFNSNGKCN